VGGALIIVFGPKGWIDLQVYRLGGRAWLDSTPLYGVLLPAAPDQWLPFTYPPLAAVLFVPLTLIPLPAALAVLTAASLAALAFVAGVVAKRVGWQPRFGVLAVSGAVVMGLALEPVRETLWFGQINLILMAMVTADCLLRRTPWPRGLLIGLAAAVKLTPAVFVLFFLPRREWKPAVTALATFVGASVVGAVLAPSGWGPYWLGVLLEPDRIGEAAYAGNQSLRGALHRLALPHSVETITWLALVAATVAAGWVAVLTLRRAGRDVEAMLVVAAVGLLCSPISWSHHWVWAVPALVVLAAAWENRRVRWTTAALAAVFLVGPHWLFPKGGELSLDLWQQVLLDAYVVVAVLGIAVLVWRGAPTTVAMRRAVLSPE
jgi:alpha-1,2-mannosyltransferase